MSRFLEPLVRSNAEISSTQFYTEFSHTSLYENFMTKINKLECPEIVNLMSIKDLKDRVFEI